MPKLVESRFRVSMESDNTTINNETVDSDFVYVNTEIGDKSSQLHLERTGRSNQIESIINARLTQLSDISNILHQTKRVMNAVIITPVTMMRFYGAKLSTLVQQWFSLGYSIAEIILLESGNIFVRKVAQLIEEWEYHFSNRAIQSMVNCSYFHL